MDWDSRDSRIFKSDLTLPVYSSRSSKVASVLEGRQPQFLTALKNDITIIAWLNEISREQAISSNKGLYVILGDRAPEPDRDTQLLLNLPFSRPTFDRIRRTFRVNISILRVLNREAATFKRTYFHYEGGTEELISYNIRSSTSLLNDISLSITTNPNTNLTHAIVYGCSPSVTADFLERLENAALPHSGKSFLHPMLMAGLFAEVERAKHVEVVEVSVTALYEYVIALRDDTLFNLEEEEEIMQKSEKKKVKGSSSSISSKKDDESSAKQGVDLWLDVCHYKTAIETWVTQLHKICAHIDELESKYQKNTILGGTELMYEGRRIKERLLDIVGDYDELLRKCTWVMDGTSLANDMAWNHLARLDSKVQLRIAQSSQRDSTQMRSIALLTMIFLPGTYVASFFAMPLFKWDADPSKKERIYSEKFWIYWVVTASLTLAVIVLWIGFSCRFRIRKRSSRRAGYERKGLLVVLGRDGRKGDEDLEGGTVSLGNEKRG